MSIVSTRSTVSTVITDGARAHHGPNNSAGEWGHNPLPFPGITEIPGPSCYCGKHGCLETWVSGRALQADYARHTQQELKAEEIIQKVRIGDRLAPLRGSGCPRFIGSGEHS